MPTGLTWVNDADAFTNGKGYLGYYRDSSYGLYRKSGAVGSNQSERTSVVQFKYTAGNGETYYYYIGYHSAAHNKPSGCVAEGSMVTMADGSQKAIEEINQGDMVMTWNSWKGVYEAQPVVIDQYHGTDEYTVTTLSFSDGTNVRMINDHGFFDVDKQTFIHITPYNVADYVGDTFVKRANDGSNVEVTLDNFTNTIEYVGNYSLVTAYNETFVVENMPCISGQEFPEQFNYFDYNADMTYNIESVERNISEYGLYIYEDFADYCTKEQFDMLNVQYYKFFEAQDCITYDEIIELMKAFL